jgi:ring-1,2-phenylacetyl-CoA epoxidase subunit PaaD
MKTKEDILSLLSEIPDPEIPVISIIELGVIRDINITDESLNYFKNHAYLLWLPSHETDRR